MNAFCFRLGFGVWDLVFATDFTQKQSWTVGVRGCVGFKEADRGAARDSNLGKASGSNDTYSGSANAR